MNNYQKGLIGTLLFLLLIPPALASWDLEKEKINFLLDRVRQSNVIFIRNGEEHSAEEAAEHLNRKLEYALSSWFTPPKKSWTVELFIEEVASSSSLSKKPYYIREADGRTLKAKKWLYQQLKLFKLN